MKHAVPAAVALIAAWLSVVPAAAMERQASDAAPATESARIAVPEPLVAETSPPDDAGAESGAAPASLPLPGRLTIRGRVLDDAGLPILAVQMFLEGSRREVAPVDRAGHFVLSVPIGPLDRFIRSPLALWLNARRTGWRIGLASGAPRLRMEVRAYDDSLGARHLNVRTNDAGATNALARAFADGRFADTLDVEFVGEPGKDPEPHDVVMDAVSDVIVSPGRVTSYGLPDSVASPAPGVAVPVPVVAPARSDRDSLKRPAERATTRPAPLAERTPALRTPRETPPDTCTCRIEGVIEVQWDHPLPERAPVALWIEGKPALRDSIELLLGSPRAFNLTAHGCGTHRVQYVVHSKLKFRERTPEPLIECTGGMRQLRIVLEPMSPRIRR